MQDFVGLGVQISWQAQDFLMWKCRVGGRCRTLWGGERSKKKYLTYQLKKYSIRINKKIFNVSKKKQIALAVKVATVLQ